MVKGLISDGPCLPEEKITSTGAKYPLEKVVMVVERNGPAEHSSTCKNLCSTKVKPAQTNLSPVSKCVGTFQTPVRSCYKRMPHVFEYGFASLPVYGVSPLQSNPFEVSNPFDDALTQRLHLPFCSPSVFARVVSPSQAENHFCWTIEDVANLQPAPIEEVLDEQAQVDPEVESRAQEAISRFFRSYQIVPSPWGENSASHTKTGSMTESPNAAAPIPKKSVRDKYHADNGLAAEKVSVPTQTCLSLPPQLPPALEEALKPYFINPEVAEQKTDDDELSTSSVRRKRLFSEEMCVSPTTSPLRGGLVMPAFKEHLYPSTPLTKVRTFEVISKISPPQFSPISRETELPRNLKSLTRLDFSANMSIDDTDTKYSQNETEAGHDDANKENVKPVTSRSDLLGDTGYNTASIRVNDITMNCNVSGQPKYL